MAAQVIIYDLAGRLSVLGADAAARELGKVSKATSSVHKGLKGLKQAGGHLMHAATGLAIIGAGVTAVLGKMAHSAMEFEQKMAYVSALTGGKNTDEFRKFEMAARSAGVTTFASSALAAEAIYDIKKAGFSTADTIAALNPVLALSSLENIKVADAAKAAASMTRAFGLEAKKSGDMVDAMAYVSKNTSASIKNLKDGMTYTSTTARMLKYDYRDVLIMLGMLNNAGLEGSKAGTTLNAALLRLSGSSARGGKYVKALGIDLIELGTGKTKSASVLLKEMMTRYTEMDKKFGTLGAVQRWMKALGLVGGKFPAVVHEMMAYKDLLPKLTAGIAGETAAERNHSFAMNLAEMRMASTLGVFQLMSNAMSTFAIEISKANLFGDVFGEKFHKVLGIIRLAASSVGGYKIADRNKIMGAFGLSEDTAAKVDKVVAGIKRGISEAIVWVEKMYRKAAEFLKKQGGGMDIESVAATATKVVLAVGLLAPAIFAAIPVVMLLGGVLKAVGAAAGPLFKLSPMLAAVVGSVTALQFTKSPQSLADMFTNTNSAAGILLGIVNDITKSFGLWGTIFAVGATKKGLSWLGQGLRAAGGAKGGVTGAITSGLGNELVEGLPVKVMNWPGGFGGIAPGVGGAAVTATAAGVPGAAASGAGGVGWNIGTAGTILTGFTIGYMAGTILDAKLNLSDKAAGVNNKDTTDEKGRNSQTADAEFKKTFAAGYSIETSKAAAAFMLNKLNWETEKDNGTSSKFDLLLKPFQLSSQWSDLYRMKKEEEKAGLSKRVHGSLVSSSGELVAPVGSAEETQTQLRNVMDKINILTNYGQMSGPGGMSEEMNAQRYNEIEKLEKQQLELVSLLKQMDNRNYTYKIEMPIMLDGRQIGASIKQGTLDELERSGGQSGGGPGSGNTTEPLTSE